VVAERVARAYLRQQARQGAPNAALAAAELDAHCRLDEPAARFLERSAQRLGWSGRALHRVLKVARTIADLAAVHEQASRGAL
jgi:magnesium chelatase family protein